MFKEVDVSCEYWREYVTLKGEVYTILQPVTLYLKEGSDSHRVLDRSGVTHYLPLKTFPIIRWEGDLVF